MTSPSPHRCTLPSTVCPARSVHTRLIPYAQDKACIDQNSIQQSLACLPVFLAGCKTLLVVAGPTYCSRLWCIMELFTFVRSGHLHSNPIPRANTPLTVRWSTALSLLSPAYLPPHSAVVRVRVCVTQWAATKGVSRSTSSPTRTTTKWRRGGG